MDNEVVMNPNKKELTVHECIERLETLFKAYKNDSEFNYQLNVEDSPFNTLKKFFMSKPCDEVMEKAFDALKRIRQETLPATYNPDFDKGECCDILYQALTELKAIKEKRIEYISGRFPNKEIIYLKNAIEQCNDQALYYASKSFGNKYIVPREDYEALKRKYTEYENKLKCIYEKNVDMKFLKDCDSAEEYNKYCDDETDEKPLTEEEFISLKG